MVDSSSPATNSPNDPRPYWIPGDVDFDSLSEELKAAIMGVITPAYGELVLKARAGLEQSVGISIVSNRLHPGKQ